MTKYQSFSQRTLPWLIAIGLTFSIALPHGSQPAVLLVFFLVLPLFLIPLDTPRRPSLVWKLTLMLPVIVSLPLFISSGTGEALAGAARFFVIGLVLIGIARINLDTMLVLRAATLAGIATVLVNINQLNALRIDWGIGVLDSAYVSVMLLCLSLAQFYLDRNRSGWRVFAGIGVICLVFVVIKTGARGAWLAMMAVFVLQFLLVSIPAKRKIIIAFISAVLLGTAIFTIPTVKSRLALTLYEITSYYENNNRASSMGYRLDFWHISLECFSEGPIGGVSYQRRSEIMERYMSKYPVSASIGNDGRSSSHNELLNALSKKGILGAVAILLLYLVPLRYFVNRFRLFSARHKICPEKRHLAMAGAGVVFTMIICGVTEAPLMNIRVGTTYGMIMIVLYHLLYIPKRVPQTTSRPIKSE